MLARILEARLEILAALNAGFAVAMLFGLGLSIDQAAGISTATNALLVLAYRVMVGKAPAAPPS